MARLARGAQLKYCALLRAEELGVLTAERAAALYVWREAKGATSAYEEQLVQLDIDLAEARSSGSSDAEARAAAS